MAIKIKISFYFRWFNWPFKIQPHALCRDYNYKVRNSKNRQKLIIAHTQEKMLNNKA